MLNSAQKMTQIDALAAQAAFIALFKATGDLSAQQSANKMSAISKVVIGIDGSVTPILPATYVASVESENAGGGSMVDIITMVDGRVIALNDEALCVFAKKDDFYEHAESQGPEPLHSIWLSSSRPAAITSDNEVQR